MHTLVRDVTDAWCDTTCSMKQVVSLQKMMVQGHRELEKEQLSGQLGKLLHYELQESYVEALCVAGPVKSCD